MGELVEELRAAAATCGAVVKFLSPSVIEGLIAKIREIHCGGSRNGTLWEVFQHSRSVQDKDGWKLAGELIGDRPVILIAEWTPERVGLALKSGHDLTCMLEESFGFEFLVTNESASFCMVFNHHDCLICVGEAIDWASGFSLFDEL